MTPKRARFQFCRHQSGVVGSGTLYPVGFMERQIMDLLFNVKELSFDFNATGAARLALLEAASIMNTAQVEGFDVAGLVIGDALESRVGVSGKTIRVVDPEKCNGVIHRYNQDLCQVFIDLSDVKKSSQGLYYPRTLILFFADGDVFTSYLQDGGGQSVGGIDFAMASTPLDMFPATASGLDPIVFGSINESERYDSIEMLRVGNTVELNGVSFDGAIEVFFGEVPTSFSLSADKMKLTATIPDNPPFEPIFVKAERTSGSHTYRDLFYTKQPFRP